MKCALQSPPTSPRREALLSTQRTACRRVNLRSDNVREGAIRGATYSGSVPVNPWYAQLTPDLRLIGREGTRRSRHTSRLMVWALVRAQIWKRSGVQGFDVEAIAFTLALQLPRMATQWKHGEYIYTIQSYDRTLTQYEARIRVHVVLNYFCWADCNATARFAIQRPRSDIPYFPFPTPEFTTIPKKKSSSRNSPRTTSASDTSSMEAPSDDQRRLSSGSVSSAYAEIVAPFNDLDWMMNVSPTATLTESDTAPHTPSLPQASQQAKKKRRPVSMFASLGSPLRQSSADYRAQWENRRRSVTLPFPVLAVPGVRGRRLICVFLLRYILDAAFRLLDAFNVPSLLIIRSSFDHMYRSDMTTLTGSHLLRALNLSCAPMITARARQSVELRHHVSARRMTSGLVSEFSPAATRLSGTFEFALKNMLTIFSRCLHLPRGALRIPPTVLLPVHHQSRAIRLPLSSIIPPEMGWTVEKTSTPPASHNDKADPLYDPNPEDRYTINTFTQGIVLDPESRNKNDPQYMSAQEGRSVRVHGSGSPLCAASAENGVAQMKPMDLGKGNKEGVGFVEQVGSASATARMFEREESVKMLESKLGRDLARETFENARASALARKLVDGFQLPSAPKTATSPWTATPFSQPNVMAKFSAALALSLFVGCLTLNASAAPTPGEVYRFANPAPDQSAFVHSPPVAGPVPTGIRENILGRAPVERLVVGRRGPSTSWDNRAEASGRSLISSLVDGNSSHSFEATWTDATLLDRDAAREEHCSPPARLSVSLPGDATYELRGSKGPVPSSLRLRNTSSLSKTMAISISKPTTAVILALCAIHWVSALPRPLPVGLSLAVPYDDARKLQRSESSGELALREAGSAWDNRAETGKILGRSPLDLSAPAGTPPRDAAAILLLPQERSPSVEGHHEEVLNHSTKTCVRTCSSVQFFWNVSGLPTPAHIDQANNLAHRHVSEGDFTVREPGTAWDNRAVIEELLPRRLSLFTLQEFINRSPLDPAFTIEVTLMKYSAGVFAFSLILISSLILTVSGQPDSVVPGDASPEGKTNIVAALTAGTNWDGCRRAAPPPPPPAYWYAHLSHVKQLCHGMQVLANLLPSGSGLVTT
ncbi:hypothetical protein NMY22_g1419 [Coprinellus aureogranulatus]|nr:hypothetical protein NMY22_g1419 [Coprinellus aureogranulatus]